MAGPDQYRPGVGSVGQYQMSAKPFCSGGINVASATGSIFSIEFPAVTSWIYISNHDSHDLRVGFSENGIKGSNYFLIHKKNDAIPTQVFNVRCKTIFLAGDTTSVDDISVFAGLTGIESELRGASGPNFSGSAGVG